MEDVIFHTSFDSALAARKAVADDPAAHFLGLTHTTQDAFIEEAWKLWGDGRVLVGGRTRSLLLLDILAEYPSLSHVRTSVRPLASFICRLAGADAFEAVIEALRSASGSDGASGVADTLGEAERTLFDAIAVYFDRLNELGLIEPGHAAHILESVMPSQHIVCDAWLDVSPAMQSLIEKVSGATLASIMPAARIEPSSNPPEARFLFPAGPAATLPLIKDEIEAFCAPTRTAIRSIKVVVCMPDPLDAYDALVADLVEYGCTCSLKAALPFGMTLFGRAFEAAYAVFTADAHWRHAVTDFASGVFSGMDAKAAQRLDADLRADRLMTCDQARDLLRESSRTFAFFEGLFGDDPLADVARLKILVESVVSSTYAVAPYELRACQELEALIAQRDQLDVRYVSLYEAAQLLSVSTSMAALCEIEDAPRIDFMSINAADALALKSYDLVIVGDMSDASFRAAPSRTAFDALAEKIDVSLGSSALDESRASFTCAQRAARRRLTCVLSLRDDDREPAYPAFVFDEYARALRHDDEPVDENCFNLPCRIVHMAQRRGEEDIATCLGWAFCDPDGRIDFDAVRRGVLREVPLVEFIPLAPQDDGIRKPILSPSAIETYLECPYRWFVERRLRLNGLDEGFGSLEKGTFAHDVFARFFNELASRGVYHLDMACADEMQELLDDIFDDSLAACADDPMARLAPAADSEILEVEALRVNMHVSLSRQMSLPPSFDVMGHELIIAPDEGIDYAGVRLNGRVDRVDVDDEQGRFVVLDYKGSVKGHGAGFADDDDIDTFVLPHKVQALIYAQALRWRLDGYACAGALYLSYGARRDEDSMAGSYDRCAYDVEDMAKTRSRVSASFDAFLDLVEERIASSIQDLTRGDIQISPRDKEACRSCAVPFCEGRL